MRPHFQLLSDKFSTLDVDDNAAYISFYEQNENDLKNLKDFETEKELYLAVVAIHTYGRSQLYVNRNLKKAEHFLNISRVLIEENRERFKIKLNEDIWYIQTLQHLLTSQLTKKNLNQAIKILEDLKYLDEDNREYYELEEKEIKRIQKYKVLMAIAYIGFGLIAISLIYRVVTDKPLWYVGRIGQIIGLCGIVSAYFFKDSLKSKAPNIVYKSWRHG